MLTTSEKRRLRKVTTGYGKMKEAEMIAQLHRSTIYAAMNGAPLEPETATKIRMFLNPNSKDSTYNGVK